MLQGCATPETRYVTVFEIQRVPDSLLTSCQKSSGAKTYEDAIKLAEQRGKEIDECNKRLEDIKAWSGGSPSRP